MTDDMTDNKEFDRLKHLLNEAAPAPDPGTKAAHLALAQENFKRAQESAGRARQTSDRPASGLLRGVKTMLAHLTTRGALTAGTALVALGFVIALPQLAERPLPGLSGSAPESESAESGRALPANPPLAEIAQGEVRERAADDAIASPAPQPQASPAAPKRAVSQLRAEGGYTRPSIAPADGIAPPPPRNTEAFAQADPNPLRITAEEPVSTFSIDVDTASWSVIRSSLTRGQRPPKEAVRIEEMVNYFPYDYPAPEAGEAPFKPTVTLMPAPWNEGTELLHIAIQGRQVSERPPLNLVFLIDTSGSMQSPDKLPLLRQSLALMLPRLGAEDQVSIVTYAGSAGQVLAPTPATDRAAILAALDTLRAGGSTAGQAGLQQAYAVAEGMAAEGEVTRVILATDGDFNVGLSDPEKLKDFIAAKRDSGTYLSVMGFGRGNLDDATMQALAQNGNGQASYIDTAYEAQKVLVDQFSGALFPIADDVKVQVEFNPAQVSEYRLIGYETRALAREDFNNDRVDAGDIGAGHSITALYEITPASSAARLTDPLRYGQTVPEGTAARPSPELAFLKLRYKAPGAAQSRLIEAPILPGMGEANDDARFAAAIAGFGELLRGSKFIGDWNYPQAIALANGARGADPFGYRAEAIRLMRLAESLAP